jgi:hypothetical protein
MLQTYIVSAPSADRVMSSLVRPESSAATPTPPVAINAT